MSDETMTPTSATLEASVDSAKSVATAPSAVTTEAVSNETSETQVMNAAAATEVDAPSDAQPDEARKPVADVPFDRAYRLSVYFRPKEGLYGLRCDELGDLGVVAETRSQALESADKALEDKIAEYAVRGENLPRPFDLDRPSDFSGSIDLKLSKSLHRDLNHAARREGTSINALIAELCAAGLVHARGEMHREARPQQRRDNPNYGRGDERREIRRRGGMSQERYKQVMEDKGAFMEYVRSLDQDTGRTKRGGPGGRRRR